MTATTTVLNTGDIVTGRPVREGKSGNRKKGVVLGAMDVRSDVVVVWWFGEGAASMDTTTMAFERELKKVGDVWDLSAPAARRMAKRANAFSRARVLTAVLARHARRMESLDA